MDARPMVLCKAAVSVRRIAAVLVRSFSISLLVCLAAQAEAPPALSTFEICWESTPGGQSCASSGSVAPADGQFDLRWSPTPAAGGFDFVEIEIENLLPIAGNAPPMTAVRHRTESDRQAFSYYSRSKRAFKARACRLGEDEIECGPFTVPLVADVPVEAASAIEVVPDPNGVSRGSTGVQSGPTAFAPGVYMSGITKYNGWYLQWANNLGREYAHPEFGTFSDLHLLWVTYMDFNGSQSTSQRNIQPVWLWAGLNRAVHYQGTGSGITYFGGALMMSRIENGVRVDTAVGEVQFRLNGTFVAPTVAWFIEDRRFYNPNYTHDQLQQGQPRWVWDNLQWTPSYLDLPEDAQSGLSAQHHWQGWWRPSDATAAADEFELMVFSSGTWEHATLAFFDGRGEPVWATANLLNSYPTLNTTPMCVYAVTDTWWPDTPHPGHPYRLHWLTHPGYSEIYTPATIEYCDVLGTWNYERTFGPELPLGKDPQLGNIDVELELPNMGRAVGSSREFDYQSDITKWKSNHAIRYIANGAEDPDICHAVADPAGGYRCKLQVSWYSDGYYPHAKLVFEYNLGGSNWIPVNVPGYPDGIGWPNGTSGPFFAFNQEFNLLSDASLEVERRYRMRLVRPKSSLEFGAGPTVIARTKDLVVRRAQSPQAWIESPSIAEIPDLATGQPLEIVAEAVTPNTQIAQVEFYAQREGGPAQSFGIATAEPYAATWTPTQSGRYDVFVVATDNVPLTAQSTAISVQVYAGSGALTVSGNPCSLPADGLAQQCYVSAFVTSVQGTPVNCLWKEPTIALPPVLVQCSTHSSWQEQVLAHATVHRLELRAHETQPIGGPQAEAEYSDSYRLAAVDIMGRVLPPRFDAAFKLQELSLEMPAGGTQQVAIEFWNSGTETWKAGNGFSLRPGNHAAHVDWSIQSVPLPHDVPPCGEVPLDECQAVRFTFEIQAPFSWPSTYAPFEWRMHVEGEGFGSHSPKVFIHFTNQMPPGAEIFPDQAIEALDEELPVHDPSVGALVGRPSVSGGAAGYEIPIVVPPGRKGMEPKVSLIYNSSAGNGIAGMGWSLSGLSMIARCPQTLEQDSAARPVDLTQEDRLCLDGVRLVATSGDYGSTGTVYATETESFARITQLGGSLVNSATYFVVESQTGEIAYYGGTSSTTTTARLIPGGTTLPMSWLVERRIDRSGNMMRYEYATFGSGEQPLSRIRYTGYGATDGDRLVEFGYELRPAGQLGYDRGSTYLAGTVLRQSRRLASIATFVGGEKVREYNLSYDQTSGATGRSLLRRVQECAFESATVQRCKPETFFEWQDAEMAHQFHVAALPQSLVPTHVIGDLDGDGSMEIVAKGDDASWHLVALNADRSVRTSIDITSAVEALPVAWIYGFSRSRWADFDLDGRADLVGHGETGNSLLVHFWDGSLTSASFSEAFTRSWNTGVQIGRSGAPNLFQVGQLVHVGDMDGDGRPDIVVIREYPANHASCRRMIEIHGNVANPTDPSAPATFPKMVERCLPMIDTGGSGWVGELVESVRDMNGDGLPDILLRWSGFAGPITGEARILFGSRAPGYSLVSRSFLELFPTSDPATTQERHRNASNIWIDVNGDGLPDFLHAAYVTGSGRWTLRMNTGGQLGNRIDLASNQGIEHCITQDHGLAPVRCDEVWQPWFAQRFRVADTNGDGREELLIPRRFANRVCVLLSEVEPTEKDRDVQVESFGFDRTPLHPEERMLYASPELGDDPDSPLGGGTDIYYACPEDPVTGVIDPSLPTAINNIPVRPMYWIRKSHVDGTSYLMDSLRIVETGTNSATVVQVPTSIVDGPRLVEAIDLYGDGLADTLTQVSCPFTSPHACAILPGGAPTALPDGSPPMSAERFINEGRGQGGLLNPDGLTPQLPDLMAIARDGHGNEAIWTYYPLSSNAGRPEASTPLYEVPAAGPDRYVDDRHIYFTSSMPVVSEMIVSDGIGGFRASSFGYREALFHHLGRGFQGFRTIIEEDEVAGIRISTVNHQKFPLAGRPEQVIKNALVRTGTEAPFEVVSFTWRCNRSDRADATACIPPTGAAEVRNPFLDKVEVRTHDLAVASQATGTPNEIAYRVETNAAGTFLSATACDASFSNESGFDVFGNLRYRMVQVFDRGDSYSTRCERESAAFSPSVGNWWIDRVDSRENEVRVEFDASNHPLPLNTPNPPQITQTTYQWNADRTLHRESFQAGIANQEVVTTYAYPGSNNFGLPSTVLVDASGDQNVGGRQTSITYSADGYFPRTITNPLGHTSAVVARARDGQPERQVDADERVTRFAYDAFGSLVRKDWRDAADAADRLPPQRMATTVCTGACGPPHARYRTTTVQDGSPTETVFFDGMGRVLRNEVRLADGTLSRVDTVYDARGLLAQRSEPHRGGESVHWTRYLSYDLLGRPIHKVEPKQLLDIGDVNHGDLETVYVYDGRTTHISLCGTSASFPVSDCLELSRSVDASGRIVVAEDALGGTTRYWHDASGNPIALRDPAGIDTRANYNAVGHRVAVQDPNQGDWSFAYNALGELLSETDARGIQTNFRYDKLGRTVERSATAQVDPGDPALDLVVDTYFWDPLHGLGQPAGHRRVVDGVLERDVMHVLDSYGRRVRTFTSQYTAPGSFRDYGHEWVYDGYYGRVKGEVWPNGMARHLIYSRYGYLDEERDPWTQVQLRRLDTVDARGQPQQETLGGLTVLRTFAPATGQPMRIQYLAGSTPGRQHDYRYNVFGSVTERILDTGIVTNPPVERFEYDKLHRLTVAARSGGASGTVSLGYDPTGNIVWKDDYSIGQGGAPGYLYGNAARTAGGNAGPNAVRRVQLNATQGGGALNFAYDNNGNLIADDGVLMFRAEYDHRNLPVEVIRGAAVSRFAYAADDSRARQTGSDGTRVYLEAYEDVLSAPTGASVETRAYFGDYAVVSRQSDGTQAIEYLLRDRLSSVDAVADVSGVLTERRAYDAFGKPREGDDWSDREPPRLASLAVTQRGYTDHEHLNSVELIHMNGRAFDYKLGRFLSVDPFIQFPLNSQSLNPYSYLLNNPLSARDPSGFLAICGKGGPTQGRVCEQKVIETVSAPGSRIKSTRERTFTVANVNGDLYAVEGTGKSAYESLTRAINGIGDAAGRPSGPSMTASPVRIEETVDVGYLVHGMSRESNEARVSFVNDPSSSKVFWGDTLGAWLPKDEHGLRHNPLTGDVISNPWSRIEGVLALADGAMVLKGLLQGAARALISRGKPQIKPGSADGDTAGQRFTQRVRDEAFAENPTSTCVFCRREGAGTQVDHAKPRSRGGNATIDNAQLACPHCNASKGARDFPMNPPRDYEGPWPPPHWPRE